MYRSPQADYGYDISDWTDIHPEFGRVSDVERLIAEAHKLGMRLLMDLVVTHSSSQHKWFLEACSSRDNPKADWYMFRDPRPGNMIMNNVTGESELVEEPTNWKACFGGPIWTYVPARDQYYLSLFMPAEPDLNFENPEVRKAVFQDAIGFWLDRGIDGFRIDTVNRISKDLSFPDAPTTLKGRLQPGSDWYINGPRSHFFIQELRKYMDNHPCVKRTGKELMLVGELPRTTYDDVLKYTHPESKELSMVFDFDMVRLGGHDNPDEVPSHMVKNLSDGHHTFTLPQFKSELAKVQDLIANGSWGTIFMENHDQCRSIDRYATPKPEFREQAAKLLCILQMTLSGTPFIYQGQEIGMENMPKHWDFNDFRDPAALNYLKATRDDGTDEQYEDARVGTLRFGRDNTRTPVQWSSGTNAGFSACRKGETWIGVHNNYVNINVEDQQKDPRSILNFWKRQIALRKKHSEIFMHGSIEILDPANTNSFFYLKTSAAGEVAVVCLNFSERHEDLVMPAWLMDTHALELLVSNLYTPKSITAQLRAWEGRVYLLTKEAAASMHAP